MSASILNMTKPRCVYLENVLNFLDGFIKVYEGKYWIEDGYSPCMLAATDEQIKTLVELGIELDFEDLVRWENGI